MSKLFQPREYFSLTAVELQVCSSRMVLFHDKYFFHTTQNTQTSETVKTPEPGLSSSTALDSNPPNFPARPMSVQQNTPHSFEVHQDRLPTAGHGAGPSVGVGSTSWFRRWFTARPQIHTGSQWDVEAVVSGSRATRLISHVSGRHALWPRTSAVSGAAWSIWCRSPGSWGVQFV